MEHETQPLTTPEQGLSWNPMTRLAREMPRDGYLVFGEYDASVPSMIGAIRVSHARDPDAWERHDHGDEVLFVLAGACTATLRDADGRTTRRDMSKGDFIIIPKGVAHHFTLHSDEVQVFFVTPRTGTLEWSEPSEREEAEQ